MNIKKIVINEFISIKIIGKNISKVGNIVGSVSGQLSSQVSVIVIVIQLSPLSSRSSVHCHFVLCTVVCVAVWIIL